MNARQLRRASAALLLAAAPAAFADDTARARQAVADQKAAADVAQVVVDAEKLARNSSPKAIERLKASLLAVDLSVELSAAKRKELAETLQAAITVLENPTAPAADPRAAARKVSARDAMAAAAGEAKEVAEGFAKAETYYLARRDDEARAILAGLARKYPGNPVAQGALLKDYNANQIAADKEATRKYADAWLKNVRGVETSAIPATGDIEFPDRKTWDRITKARTAPAVKLTEKEERLLESLNTSVKVDYRGRPFKEALQELSNAMGKEINVDEKSLEDLGLDLLRPVTFTGNVSARTALRAILQSQGLTFVVKDEMIQVLTLEKAQATLITRSYYLGDLVTGNGAFGNAVQWGPALSYQQTAENAKIVVEAITSSIDPLAWKSERSNGPCTVQFHLPTLSIVVRASAEVHASLGNQLSGKK